MTKGLIRTTRGLLHLGQAVLGLETVLNQLKTEPGLRAMTVLVARFDNERELRQRMNVRTQGTFVVYRGEREKARVVGDTAADRIRTALQSAL